MALKSALTIWSPPIGDVFFGSAQAGAIGTSFGNGAATSGANAQNSLQMGSSGDLNVQQVSAGRSPGATGADNVLAVYTLPAGALDITGRVLDIQAQGSFTTNTNAKTVKIIWGATTAVVGSTVTGGAVIGSIIITTGSAANGGGWQLMASVSKYGAAGSNTQLALHQASQSGITPGALLAPSLLTSPENAPILIAITGNAATATSDIVFNFFQLTGYN